MYIYIGRCIGTSAGKGIGIGIRISVGVGSGICIRLGADIGMRYWSK